MIRSMVAVSLLVLGLYASADTPATCTNFAGDYWSGELYGLTSTMTDIEMKITQTDCTSLKVEGHGRDAVQKDIVEFVIDVIPDGQERQLIGTGTRTLHAAFEWEKKGLRAIVRDEQVIPSKGNKLVARDMLVSLKKKSGDYYLDVAPHDGTYDPEVMGWAIKK